MRFYYLVAEGSISASHIRRINTSFITIAIGHVMCIKNKSTDFHFTMKEKPTIQFPSHFFNKF